MYTQNDDSLVALQCMPSGLRNVSLKGGASATAGVGFTCTFLVDPVPLVSANKVAQSMPKRGRHNIRYRIASLKRLSQSQ